MTSPAEARAARRGGYLYTLALAALGVVYGDIGTSPLYAIRYSFYGPHGIAVTPGNVLGELQCGSGSCEYVQTSRYAELLGLPVAVYGVAGYATLLGLGLAGLQPGLASDRRVSVLLAALTTVGFAFTLYLTAIELFVLHAICRWCVASAVIMTAAWLLSLADLRRAPATRP